MSLAAIGSTWRKWWLNQEKNQLQYLIALLFSCFSFKYLQCPYAKDLTNINILWGKKYFSISISSSSKLYFTFNRKTKQNNVFVVVFKGRNRARGLDQDKILSANVGQSKGYELSNSKNGRRGRLWEHKTKNTQTALNQSLTSAWQKVPSNLDKMTLDEVPRKSSLFIWAHLVTWLIVMLFIKA